MTSIPMSTGYIDVKVKIGKVEFSNTDLQIDSIKINNGCYDGSVFGVGNVYIKNASITMSYRGGISKGLSMEIFFLHQGEWISFGRFIVTETPVISGDKLSVSLESELSQTMTTSVVFEKAMQEYSLKQIKSKIEEIVGRTILFVPDLSNEEYTSFLDGKSACFLKNIQNYVDQSAIDTGISVRDMLSGLAILFGGNAYEDRSDRIIIKQKTYSENSDRYILSDYLDSNYRYSQETYAVRVIGVSFLPWSLSLYYPPNASGQICTVNYLGEDRVDNMIQYDPTAENYTAYDYNISCDWIGWTSDGSTFDTHAPAPGGKYAQCLRQGDLIYKSCEMTFVGIDFGWNIAPGNLIKVQVPELDDPITVLCGEISYEWDGGFTTSVSCSCNIESSGSYSTQVSTRASAVAVQEGRETSLDLNYANITFSNIEDSTIRGSIFKDGTIEGSKIKDATLTGAKIEDATIGFEKVDKSFISNLTADEAYISSLKAEVADIGYLTADEADITYAKITRLEVLESQTAEKLSVKDFEAEAAKIGYLKADEANIKYALITSLEAVDGKIDNLQAITITTDNLNAKVAELGYLTAGTAEVAYAKIDLSNVGSQVVSSSMIIDGAVTNEKVANLSANKITSGTIDASKITVTNLNADNLTVGTINGQRIGVGSLSLDKLAKEVPTKEYLDSVEKNLQGQIDGAIETFTKTEIPTLNNEPANAWTDDETRKKHIGDICYVINPTSSADGYCYRFADLGTNESSDYSWVLIKDSDVTKALQDIIDINGEITGIKSFDESISSWKVDTDSELSSLKTRTESLETDLGDKVSSTVFNEVKQTVDENSSSISSMQTEIGKKADGSTVETLTNTVNEVKQTADSNSSSISSMQTEIGKKADGSTVTGLSTKTSNLEQNLDGFKTEVSKTYTTKTEFNNLEIGGANIFPNSTTLIGGGWTGTMADSNVAVGLSDPVGKYNAISMIGTATGDNYRIIYNLIPEDGTYTLSLWAKSDSEVKIRNYHGNNKFIGEMDLTTDWKKFVFTRENYLKGDRVYFGGGSTWVKGVKLYIAYPKLEKGNKATDWSPAPEDLENDSSAKADAALQSAKSYIDQTAESINQVVSKKVGNNEIISKINQSAEKITISADKLNLNGYLTISNANEKYDEKGVAEDKINNLEIGGRNLAHETKMLKLGSGTWDSSTWRQSGSGGALSNITFSDSPIDDIDSGILINITTANTQIGFCQDQYPNIVKDEYYTMSAWVKPSKAAKIRLEPYWKSSTSSIASPWYDVEPNKWTKVSFTGKAQQTHDTTSIGYVYAMSSEVGTSVTVCGLKVEKGNKVTDWFPAPEDISVETIYTPNTTTIDGGKITTSSIKAKSIDVDNLFAQDITATGTITGATLKGATAEIDAGKIGPLSIASDDGNLRFELDDAYYLRIGGQIYGKGINIFDNYGFTQVIYSSSGIWMRDESDGGWDTIITPSRITVGNIIHGASGEGFEIDESTTVNNNLFVNKRIVANELSIQTGVELYHPNSTPYIDFHNGQYGQSNVDYDFRILSSKKNSLSFISNSSGNVFYIDGASVMENNYRVIGCTVTISGNFTCKKYRDGRLIIEYRSKTTSAIGMTTKDTSGIYYAKGAGGTFPIEFIDVPSIVCGLSVPDGTCPFAHVTFDGMSKAGYGRIMFWSSFSGNALPIGTVVSAIFTGKWK